MDKEQTIELVKFIILLLAAVDLDALQAINADARTSQGYWDNIGVMLDPTTYRRLLHDGSLDEARLQVDVVDHLIQARAAIAQIAANQERHHVPKAREA